MSKPIKIKVTADEVTFLYDDRIPLAPFGSVTVERASNVEYDNELGGWTIQFADGSYLVEDAIDSMDRRNAMVFTNRQEALAMEVEAIHMFGLVS